jgi:hypothetical protein
MMGDSRGLWRIAIEADREVYWESLYWFLFNLLGATLPILVSGIILLPLLDREFSWTEFGRHGELALYAAAFLAPTLRVISRDMRDAGFIHRQLFVLVTGALLLAATAIYALVIAVDQIPPGIIGRLEIDAPVLLRMSGKLFAVSVILSTFVRFIDYSRRPPQSTQVLNEEKKGLERLNNEFDNTPTASEPKKGVVDSVNFEDPRDAQSDQGNKT